MPVAEIDKWPINARQVWCHQHARYGLPTEELIAWLREQIGTRSALEIGSGAGDLAHHLGIRGTDNKLQQEPVIAAYYRALGQPTIKYPDWVERLEANTAIQRHRPDVVIGSWITHWIDPRKPAPAGGGNAYGVKEDQILTSGAIYIMIGNLHIHEHKPILKKPHETIELPFLRSRSARADLDRVFIWGR
jgi:hypothetical protein